MTEDQYKASIKRLAMCCKGYPMLLKTAKEQILYEIYQDAMQKQPSVREHLLTECSDSSLFTIPNMYYAIVYSKNREIHNGFTVLVGLVGTVLERISTAAIIADVVTQVYADRGKL